MKKWKLKRQIEIIEEGGEIEQNTLLFDSLKGKTRPMRNKEEAHDYRYFPDPDLFPLKIEDSLIQSLIKEIPELPDERKKRYINDYKLTNYDSSVLTSEKNISDFFDKVLEVHSDLKESAKLVVNWITSELFAILKKNNLDIQQSPITPENLGNLIKLINSDKISGKIAKKIFEDMFQSKESPEKIVEEKDLIQVTDAKEIEIIIEKILNDNQDKVKDYKKGKTKLLSLFVGQAMKESEGKANPKKLNQILINKLK